MDTYKEIKIPVKDDEDLVVEVSLDDVTQKPAEEPADEPQDEPVAPKQKSDKNDDFGYRNKKSRSEKRIKQLHGEKTQLQRELQMERQARFEMEKQLKSDNKGTKEDKKQVLTKQLAILQQQLVDKAKEGDDEAVVRLQDEYFSAKMELSDLDKELKSWQEVKEQPQQQVQNQVPEKALEWIEDHPTFNTDELFYASAIIVNNQLVKEGFDPNSDEFYAEIDKRLAPRFPEVFGKKRKTVASKPQNDVQYTEDNLEDDDGEHFEDQDDESEVEINEEPIKERKRPLVSPSSRTGPSNAMSKVGTKPNTVVLSPADRAQAERWGLSVGQMARRILHSEKNARTDGYVPIFIDNK